MLLRDAAFSHVLLLRVPQHILAMEKRFVTANFSFRFFTSMLGFVVVNTFFAHRYFNNPKARFFRTAMSYRVDIQQQKHTDALSRVGKRTI